jgi:coproporphyrinogen III oxidase
MSRAKEVIQFLHDIENQFEEFCQKFNIGVGLEKKLWDSPLGDIRVVISRGDVFEKASAIYCDLEIDTPPVLAEKTGAKDARMQALVLEIGIHPVNPYIPKGYIELRANIGESVVLAGGTDIFPYFPKQNDIDLFADRIKSICSKHGQDYESMRKVRADFFQSKYRKGSVGSHAGIYFFQLAEEKLPFFKDMAETFFDAYEELVKKRKAESFTQKDREHQRKLHGEWVQWILLEDDGTRFGLEKGIPPDALLGAILPPVAKF